MQRQHNFTDNVVINHVLNGKNFGLEQQNKRDSKHFLRVSEVIVVIPYARVLARKDPHYNCTYLVSR